MTNTNAPMNLTHYAAGFWNGYRQLRTIDIPAARAAIKAAIGITNDLTFRNYRYGIIEPKASQAVAIERIFNAYGITTNIWGDDLRKPTR